MKSARIYIIAALLLGIVCVGTILLWPGILLDAGYMNLSSMQRITYVKENVIQTETTRRFSDSATIIDLANGEQWFAHNGYVSLWFGPDNITQTYMHMTAMSAALFTPQRDTVMAIGLASGISPGVAGLLFDRVTVAEINPAVLDVIDRFRDKNYAITENPGVTIELEDGIVTLAQSTETYDVILSSVPSPTYYSASKLWTKEVLELMEERLTPGGIYSGWFDARLEAEGMQIMLKTLNTVFADCKLIFMSPSYFNTICSNEPLTRNTSEMTDWPEPLKAQFAKHGITDITTFLTDLIIDPNPSLYANADIPLNTLDRPVLEFTALRAGTDSRTGTLLALLARGMFTDIPKESYPRVCKNIRAILPNTQAMDSLFYAYCAVES